jgi:hypothetical protein
VRGLSVSVVLPYYWSVTKKERSAYRGAGAGISGKM